MSGTMKVLVMLVLWFLYTIIAYSSCLEQCCSASAEEVVTPPVSEEIKRFPLDFKWDDQTAFQNNGFNELKIDHLAAMSDDNIFEITGIYYNDESTPEGFENMGLARAAQLKEYYLSDIPDERIRLTSEKRNRADPIEGYFESAAFKWISNAVEAPQLEEIAEGTIIRFPFNSTKKDVNEEVDNYLAKLAERVIQSGQNISLTGHTDNKGKDSYNLRLSRKRAEQIKSILISKGVDSKQVTVDYKGSSDPKSSNSTEAGRHDNRRVVVKLLE